MDVTKELFRQGRAAVACMWKFKIHVYCGGRELKVRFKRFPVSMGASSLKASNRVLVRSIWRKCVVASVGKCILVVSSLHLSTDV